MSFNAIPSFILYGEELTDTPPQFAHIETIAARSALYDWEIAPHRHLHSVQVLLVLTGQVVFRCDDRTRILDAPSHMVVPIGSVHGFRFTPETSGYVLTLSAGFAARGIDAADPMLRMLSHGASGLIPTDDMGRITWLCAEMLAIQSDWRAPQPLFLALAEALVRSLPLEPRDETSPPDTQLLSGFRHLIELHLREHRPVSWYARILGTTDRTLTRICRRRLDCTPVQVIHARLTLEARRLLRFTNASIVQVAEDLGFSDPSYFSRFYLRMTGRRPQQDKDVRLARRD